MYDMLKKRKNNNYLPIFKDFGQRNTQVFKFREPLQVSNIFQKKYWKIIGRIYEYSLFYLILKRKSYLIIQERGSKRNKGQKKEE